MLQLQGLTVAARGITYTSELRGHYLADGLAHHARRDSTAAALAHVAPVSSDATLVR